MSEENLHNIVFETIRQRRSIGKMTDQPPTRWQIERMLEAATHAPNHHKVEPWGFFVLAGKARNELGEIMATSLAARMTDTTGEKAQTILSKERAKPLRAPVLIIVAAERPRQDNVIAIENVEATAAAVQNMLLAGEEMGLACMWRTGDAAYDPRVKQWLGLASEDHIVAIVYVGHPAIPWQERRPGSIKQKTTWLNWEDRD
ncbi:MAG TPA: nitroreductase [Ktedonosporobacter sp.]|jgi:nitroreductase|nr:nitroreductase [Ktedonosporobacter sp.]